MYVWPVRSVLGWTAVPPSAGIFYGITQRKLPEELVVKAQPLGRRLTWTKITGQGPNALDSTSRSTSERRSPMIRPQNVPSFLATQGSIHVYAIYKPSGACAAFTRYTEHPSFTQGSCSYGACASETKYVDCRGPEIASSAGWQGNSPSDCQAVEAHRFGRALASVDPRYSLGSEAPNYLAVTVTMSRSAALSGSIADPRMYPSTPCINRHLLAAALGPLHDAFEAGADGRRVFLNDFVRVLQNVVGDRFRILRGFVARIFKGVHEPTDRLQH